METQLKALANLGTLGTFVGMLTDSRSFVSYTRHEYFRRIICNLLGKWIEEGEYPEDIQHLNRLSREFATTMQKNILGYKLLKKYGSERYDKIRKCKRNLQKFRCRYRRNNKKLSETMDSKFKKGHL